MHDRSAAVYGLCRRYAFIGENAMKRMMIKKGSVRKGFLAAAAAVTAVVSFTSCAALEMLDSMAAGEEKNENVPAYNASVSAPSDDETAESIPDAGSESSEAESSDGEKGTLDVITDILTGGEEQNSSQVSAENGDGTPQAQDTETGEEVSSGAVSPAALPDAEQPETVLPPDNAPGETTPFTQVADDTSLPSDSSIYSAEAYTQESGMPAGGGGTLSAYLAYSEIVRRTADHVAGDPSYKDEFCRYYITDIDENGVSELLVETGTIEADRTVYVYTFDGTQPVTLGSFVSWHTTLGKGSGVIYSETAAMGSYLMNTIRIQDGKLFTERSAESTNESQLTEPLTGYGLNDRSALEQLRN